MHSQYASYASCQSCHHAFKWVEIQFFQEQNHIAESQLNVLGHECVHVCHTQRHRLRLALFTRYPNHEEEVSASKEGNVVKFLSPPITAIMNSTWHMSKTPLSLSWKESLFWKKKWGAEWNACEEVSARTELAFLKLNTNIFSYQLDVPQPEHYSQN